LTIVGVHPFVFFVGILDSKRSTIGPKTKGATMEGEDLLVVSRAKKKKNYCCKTKNFKPLEYNYFQFSFRF
jgi:hypothetical protein